MFPPPGESPPPPSEDQQEDDERATLRLSALEFMISLSEAKPTMVKKVAGWVDIIVRACLEGMGELDEDDSGGLDGWLAEDVHLPPFRCFASLLTGL